MSIATTQIGSQSPVIRPTFLTVSDLRRDFAERLTHEREAKSLSRQSLAILADVDPKTIKRLEEQKSDARPQTVRKLAEALDIDPSRLRPPEELEADQLQRIERRLDLIMKVMGIEDIEPLTDDAESCADAARSQMRRRGGRSSETHDGQRPGGCGP